MAESWIERAERALRGESPEGIDLVALRAQNVLDAHGRSALLAPLLAAFMWGAVVFREKLAQPLDPLTLLLRLIALALSLRAILLGAMLIGRLRVYLSKRRYGLALSAEGFLLRTPRADFAVPKHDVIDIRECGAWQERSARRWDPVYVVTRPSSGRTHLTIPPLFEHTPGALAERLMRWRGPLPEPASPRSEAPGELVSSLYDRAARGEDAMGVAPIWLGRGFMRRGPFATVLLGLSVLQGFVQLPVASRTRVTLIAAVVVGLCVVAVPGLWLVLARNQVAPRKGLAFVLTPAEILERLRSGVRRVRWPDVARIDISTRRAWSILKGPHHARSLVLELKDGGALRYAEGLFSIPLEVVAALCDAYRKGTLPDPVKASGET